MHYKYPIAVAICGVPITVAALLAPPASNCISALFWTQLLA